MAIINVTNSNFKEEVLSGDKPVLVDFWAPWCGYCVRFSPILEKFSEKHPEVKVCKLNVDDDLVDAESYGISSIPALLLFKNGEVVKRDVGSKTLNELENFVL